MHTASQIFADIMEFPHMFIQWQYVMAKLYQEY